MGKKAYCKGSWLLETACGDCARCLEEAKTLIPNLQLRIKMLNEGIEKIWVFIPPIPLKYDLPDNIKVVHYDALRKALYSAISSPSPKVES